MPLIKNVPEMSGRMGRLMALATVEGAVLLEYGSMGHMVYAEKWKGQLGAAPTAELYTTHIGEKEIVLGLTDRLEEAVGNLIRTKKPPAIFVIPSSILEMIGTDLGPVCDELSEKSATKVLFSRKGGFRARGGDGIEEALFQLAREIADAPDGTEESFNLLGCCADHTGFRNDAREIARIMKGAFSLDMHCALTGISSMERIRTMNRARLNVVHRWEALKAAQYLEGEYGIPYVYVPAYGLAGTLAFLEEAGRALGREAKSDFVETEKAEVLRQIELCRARFSHDENKPTVNIGGPSDRVRGIASFLVEELGFARGLVWASDRREAGLAWMTDDEAFDLIRPGFTLAAPEITERAGMGRMHALTWSAATQDIDPDVPTFAGFGGTVGLCFLVSGQ